MINEEFDGVFRFTNASDEEFKVLWNNKEYVFPARSRSPMIIPGESLENIQEIRKRFAKKWAEREWFKSPRHQELLEMGRRANGVFPIRDDKELEPYIQMCLEPLPIAQAKVIEGPSQEIKTTASKPVSENSNLNAEFKDVPIQTYGVQPNTV